MILHKHVTFAALVFGIAVLGLAVAALLGLPAPSQAAQAESRTSANLWADVKAPQVTIADFAFSPATLTIPSGTTVTWTNRDDTVHTVTDVDRAFSSQGLETGDTYSRTFTAPGTYKYFCALHPRMTAIVIVK